MRPHRFSALAKSSDARRFDSGRYRDGVQCLLGRALTHYAAAQLAGVTLAALVLTPTAAVPSATAPSHAERLGQAGGAELTAGPSTTVVRFLPLPIYTGLNALTRS